MHILMLIWWLPLNRISKEETSGIMIYEQAYICCHCNKHQTKCCFVSEFKWKIIKNGETTEKNDTKTFNSFIYTHTHAQTIAHRERWSVPEQRVGVVLCSIVAFLWFFIVFNYEKWSSHEKWKKICLRKQVRSFSLSVVWCPHATRVWRFIKRVA